MEELKRIKDQILKSRDIQEILRKFSNAPTVHAKVNFAEGVLNNFRHISRLEREHPLRIAKDERKALDFLNKAREILNKKSESDAVVMGNYNKCISFAERNSETIFASYLGRATILLKWKQYDDCLDNIKLARSTGHGGKSGNTELAKIESECLRQIQEPQSSPRPPFQAQLSYPAHPSVPFIAEMLDLVPGARDTRVYSRQALKAGDIISIEEPFCFYVTEPMHRYKCVTCASDLNTVIPCPNCTRTLFCSKTCLEEGNRTFHRFECPIINFLLEVLDDFYYLSLRLTLISISMFTSVRQMIEFWKDEANKNKNAFTIDYKAPNRKREQYRAIINWGVNRDKQAQVDIFQVGLVAAIIKNFFLKHTPLKDFLITEHDKNFFGEILFRHIQVCPQNCEAILNPLSHNGGDRSLQVMALGAYPLLSILHITHEPNVLRTFEGTKCVVTVQKNTMRNDTVIQPFCHHQLVEHTKLQLAYDSALFDDLEFVDMPQKLNLKDVTRLLNGDRQFAEDHIDLYADYLMKYGHFYPCYQITIMEHCLYMALGLLADAVPLESTLRNMFPKHNIQ